MIKNWNIENMTGYKPITTYYEDFGRAEEYDLLTGNADYPVVKLTYQQIKDKLLADITNNYKEYTEFVMVLNWKIWEHYIPNEPLAEIYKELWIKEDDRALTTLEGDQLSYFVHTTD